MTILLLRGYNNYFNRIKKSETTITAYKEASTSYLEYGNVNFDPQDGILTSLVVGSSNQLEQSDHILDFENNETPDYLIVHDNSNIASRWFVLETVKIRSGQYKLALRRDVLIDYEASIMNSPCYVEKGNISNYDSALLLTSEGMTFNQIKTSEKLLRDKTDCAWLVAYLKKDITETKTVTYTPRSTTAQDIAGKSWINCVTFVPLSGSATNATKKAFKYNNSESSVKFRTYYPGFTIGIGRVNKNIRTTIGLDYRLLDNKYRAAHEDWQGLNSAALDLEIHNASGWDVREIEDPDALKLSNEIWDHTVNWSYCKNFFDNMVSLTKYNTTQGNAYQELTQEELDDLMSYNGAEVFYNNKTYVLTVGQGTDRSHETYYTGEDTIANDYFSSLYYEFKPKWFLLRNQDNPGKKKVKITLKGKEYVITAQEKLADQTITYTLPLPANRNVCEDATYDMLAFPIDPAENPLNVDLPKNPQTAGDQPVYIDAGGTDRLRLKNIGETQFSIAMELLTKLGAGTEAGYVYDLQLLPYCPIPEVESRTEVIIPSWDIDKNPTHVELEIADLDSKFYTVLYNNLNQARGIVFYPRKANFSKDIELGIKNEHIENRAIVIKDPVFKFENTYDEDNHPMYYFNFPYGTVKDIDMDNLIMPESFDWDDTGVSGGSGGIWGCTVYFSDATTTTPQAEKVFLGEMSLTAEWIIPDTCLDRKVFSQTDFYRLTSPNYNGIFEFNKEKLSNGITKVNVDCTYKPYSPYIKLNPNLANGYYSKDDFNDSIGLICGGDFSLPMISDAFINYELQNRNYQAVFNRSIQNMDVGHKIAREQLDFQGTMGTIMGGFTGSAAGLSTGMKTGNPYVAAGMAIAGGVAGNVLPAVGWSKDRDWLERQQSESRSFEIDKFNYSIGNVQALPQTVTKSSPISYNNKIWPILEYFTCKDEEKEILRSKIKYNGMTVMAIGTLSDYVIPGGFVKGKMIRLNDLGDDSHVANAIYEEVDKGFYEGE